MSSYWVHGLTRLWVIWDVYVYRDNGASLSTAMYLAQFEIYEMYYDSLKLRDIVGEDNLESISYDFEQLAK